MQEYQIVKVKKCPCGNSITLSARVTGYNSSAIRYEGITNRDADDRVMCTCGKVYPLHGIIEKWINSNQPNRLMKG